MNEPILCYIEGDWAYFTTQNLDDQWGDDWDDAPYDCNAGEPYEPRGSEDWEITKVAYDADLASPSFPGDRYYSVEQINKHAVPWLRPPFHTSDQGDPVLIWAGTPLSEFKRLIREAGGEVYVREDETV